MRPSLFEQDCRDKANRYPYCLGWKRVGDLAVYYDLRNGKVHETLPIDDVYRHGIRKAKIIAVGGFIGDDVAT